MRRLKHRHLAEGELHQAAVHVALDRGLHAVTLQAVADLLQVPARSVLALHPVEADLVASTFSRIVAAELAEVKRLVLAHPSPLRQMQALLETLAAPTRIEVDAVRLGAWSLGHRDPVLGAAVRDEEHGWQQFVAAVVRRGVRSGDFLPVDPDEAAAQLLTIINGMTLYSLVGHRSGADRMRSLRRVAEVDLGMRFDGAASEPSVV